MDREIVSPDQILDTPVMVVDETIMQTNIDEMQALANSLGVNLRPHIKTHKTPQIALRQIAAGAVGITCAKLGEAEVMVDGGVRDVLIAYPTIGELKIKRLLALQERARVIVGVDSHEAADQLSSAMSQAERVLDVYIEVDTGQHRSGVAAGEAAVNLGLEIARHPGLRLVGLFSHEGHANTQPPESIGDVAVAAGQALVATAEELRRQGVPISEVSVGSTPAAPYTATVPGITEMRPGTYVFRDTSGFRYGVHGPARCAARVVATVVSHAAPDRCIIDAGAKTLALDKGPGHPGHGYIVGHPGAIIHALSEEHGWVQIPEDDPGFTIGQRVEVIANHICPAVNLHDNLVIVRDGVVVDTWKVAARGKIT
ncbi:MAG: alanine racemase [Thermomicrobiales bacterium]|nr:alanine racemase [Thermomicrobiales bacterium]